MQEQFPQQITRRMQQDAERLTTPERLDRIWRSISQRLDLEDAREQERKTPRS